MPAMPGSRLVMVEAEFILGGLEAVFNRPAMAFDGNKRLYSCPGRAPGCEEGKIAVADIATDQEAPGPKTRFRLIIVFGIEIGEFAIDPVVKPGTFGTRTSGQALPGIGRDIPGNLFCRASNRRLARPGAEMMIRFDPKNIAC